MNNDNDKLQIAKYQDAAQSIKNAILKSQYQALKLANREQLALYYGVGRFISQNSRKGFWGANAISCISQNLQAELPGLRGFSERNLKYMRTFYEEWAMLDGKSAVAIADCTTVSVVEINRQLQLPIFKDFPLEDFFSRYSVM